MSKKVNSTPLSMPLRPSAPKSDLPKAIPQSQVPPTSKLPPPPKK